VGALTAENHALQVALSAETDTARSYLATTLRLEHELTAARAELARLTTLRLSEEAPKDGTSILGACPGYGVRNWFKMWLKYDVWGWIINAPMSDPAGGHCTGRRTRKPVYCPDCDGSGVPPGRAMP
jgi:hypothetical protein